VLELAWLLSGLFSDRLIREMIKIWNFIINKLPNTFVEKTQARLVTQKVLLHDFRLPPRGELFGAITQRVAVITYRRFGETYWYNLEESKCQKKFFLAF
jgi:hypothetical protein